jgi:hypothetical protein
MSGTELRGRRGGTCFKRDPAGRGGESCGPRADATADKHSAPDLMLRPNVGILRTLDFMQASAILRAAEPVKAQEKA